MWYFVLVLPLKYGRYVVLASDMWQLPQICGIMLPRVCGTLRCDMWYLYICGSYLRYVADTSVDRHIAALLHEEKLPEDNDICEGDI